MLFLVFHHTVQRRLCNINVSCFYKRSHVSEEKRKQKRSYVRTVNICIAGYDDFVVARFLDVEFVSKSCPDCCCERYNFAAVEYLMEPCLFHVQNLSPQGEYCLEFPVAALFAASSCAVTFNNIQLAFFRISV